MQETVAGKTPAGVRLRPVNWLTVLFIGPFLFYVFAFLVLPSLRLLQQAFSGEHGFTFKYIAQLGQAQTVTAFVNSIILSSVSALVGLLIGGVLAYLILRPGAPRGLRSMVTSFSAVAANFAGVPLAFAFISTLGSLGLVTLWLKGLGINLYAQGFSLYSVTGLIVVYAYFQIPLMIIVITPAIEGLRGEWREAAENLGANQWVYWRHVGLPILLPSLMSAYILLFGNAFSAYATPYALTSGSLALVPVEISNVLSGNVMLSPQTGAALALGMIAVMVVIMLFYAIAARRAGRWMRR
ncbi:ABC transporter permease [Acidihalobacter ferrooxydans]|uniref:ABC transporter permease n=1 Tax=Acidihalobacter ferrooxydans TaxID=1765967 RepID=A0A1P8UHH5_9GAMM|nr:ABC transporter permease subunit [Acidihalobacter ferrooxydans]APZ43289.1 ABC transporter permease [Acidihalobacter ferrooxydans]